jgi:hypothetical protein
MGYSKESMLQELITDSPYISVQVPPFDSPEAFDASMMRLGTIDGNMPRGANHLSYSPVEEGPRGGPVVGRLGRYPGD